MSFFKISAPIASSQPIGPATPPALSAGMFAPPRPAQPTYTPGDFIRNAAGGSAPTAAPAGGGGGGGKYVVGIGSKRRAGGWIDTVQYWSDGTTSVLESVQDFTARDAALQMFRNLGLGDSFINSLMQSIDRVYQQNIMPTDAQIMNAIYTSDAYKQRFKANEIIKQRMANGGGRPGDRMLTPAEYIDAERSFRDVYAQYGLPTGFWDSQDDFTNLIANGVSVGELKDRAEIAYQALNYADSNVTNALRDYYGLSTGDLIAYLLDPSKAAPLLFGKQGKNNQGINDKTALRKTYEAADLGGTASRLGEQATKNLSEEITNLNLTEQGKRSMADAATKAADVRRLGSLYGDSTLGFESLVREDLGLTGGQEAGRKRKKLASRERANFSGQSAIDRSSLRRRNDV